MLVYYIANIEKRRRPRGHIVLIRLVLENNLESTARTEYAGKYLIHRNMMDNIPGVHIILIQSISKTEYCILLQSPPEFRKQVFFRRIQFE